MTLDPTKVHSSSTIQTFQNTNITTGTLSVSSFTFGSGAAQTLTLSIPTTYSEEFAQCLANFSFDSSKWYILPQVRANIIKPASNVYAQVLSSYTSSNLILTLILIPTGGGPWSYSAFTVTLKLKTFITPT